MRRALIVGIDAYSFAPLHGCVNDAVRMESVLARHEDGSPNFDCRIVTASGHAKNVVTRPFLREQFEELFSHEADVALFYFSGHGTINNLGGYLVTQDAASYDEGVAMEQLLAFANRSKAREVVIILDCCHSGALGAVPEVQNDRAVLREGVSVLTASRATQVSMEVNGAGLFTGLVCDALEGGASDVIGNVTVAGVYAYADQILGAWDQRPLFKSHVSKLLPLRKCQPEVELSLLRRLPELFPAPDQLYALDPSYEPTAEPRDAQREAIFGQLQRLRGARLVVPVDEEHMYYAAMNSKACRLTPLGKFYWRMANEGRL